MRGAEDLPLRLVDREVGGARQLDRMLQVARALLCQQPLSNMMQERRE